MADRWAEIVDNDDDAVCCFPGCLRYTSIRADTEIFWGIQFCDPQPDNCATPEGPLVQQNHYLMFEKVVAVGPANVVHWCENLGIDLGTKGTCGNCGNECRKPPGEYLCGECRES